MKLTRKFADKYVRTFVIVQLFDSKLGKTQGKLQTSMLAHLLLTKNFGRYGNK